jgi:hypothetical protein
MGEAACPIPRACSNALGDLPWLSHAIQNAVLSVLLRGASAGALLDRQGGEFPAAPGPRSRAQAFYGYANHVAVRP